MGILPVGPPGRTGTLTRCTRRTAERRRLTVAGWLIVGWAASRRAFQTMS